jgi:hypothetical protein
MEGGQIGSPGLVGLLGKSLLSWIALLLVAMIILPGA